MFTKELSGLTLTSEAADTMFPNIKGVFFPGDESFLATLRALLYRRIPEGEGVKLTFSSSSYSKNAVENSSKKDCINAFIAGLGVYHGSGTLGIHLFNGSEDSMEACFAVVENGGLESVLVEYKAQPDVSQWLSQHGKFKAAVFSSETEKNTLIFISKIDCKRWHLLQSMIPRYFPWYFQDKPVNEEEKELVLSLTGRYAPKYEEKIEAFASRLDIRTAGLRLTLGGFEAKFEEAKLANVKQMIRSANRQLDDLEEKFRDLYQKLEGLTTTELGLVEKIKLSANSDSDFLEYFISNKSLHLISAENGILEFIVMTTISNYDPELFEGAVNGVGKSFFYRDYETHERYENQEMTDERICRLMKAIFQDEILKLRVCAAYKLDFLNGYYEGLEYYNYPDFISRSHTPNQHIHHYGCLGNNRPHIRKAVKEHDYIGAVSLCCASAMNFNMSEANTGTFFMREVLSENAPRCIQLPDGSAVTPLEAVKWLETRDENKKTEEEEK